MRKRFHFSQNTGNHEKMYGMNGKCADLWKWKHSQCYGKPAVYECKENQFGLIDCSFSVILFSFNGWILMINLSYTYF